MYRLYKGFSSQGTCTDKVNILSKSIAALFPVVGRSDQFYKSLRAEKDSVTRLSNQFYPKTLPGPHMNRLQRVLQKMSLSERYL